MIKMKGTLVEFVETYIKFHSLVKPIIFPLKEQKNANNRHLISHCLVEP